TATASGSWGVTYPSGLSSKSQPELATTISTQLSGVYKVDFTIPGSTTPNWSATIIVPFAVTITTDPAGVLSGTVANHSTIHLPAGKVSAITLTATASGSWGVTYPSGLSSKSQPELATTISTQLSGVYKVDLTIPHSTTPSW